MVWYKVVDNGVAAAGPATGAPRPPATVKTMAAGARPVEHRAGSGTKTSGREENDMNSAEFGGGGQGSYTPPTRIWIPVPTHQPAGARPMARPNNDWRQDRQQPFQAPRAGIPSF